MTNPDTPIIPRNEKTKVGWSVLTDLNDLGWSYREPQND